MLRVRSIRSIDEFVGAPGDPDDYKNTVVQMWASGESKPEWCFVLEEGSERVGRIGFRVTATTDDPSWLGSLPPTELFAFGLHLPWDGEYLDRGRHLLDGSIGFIRGHVPDLLEVRINNEVHPHALPRCRLMETYGPELFQEKQGYFWVDDGSPVERGDHLVFRPISDVGEEAYRSIMAPCGEGTLDRNDRYYWEGCGPENWAAQMMGYLKDEDADMWLLGFEGDSAVGYVAVRSEEDWGSTIAHIGVVPEHRGKGFIHDLLVAGTAAARRAGITTMLSDVDVLNKPMKSAMIRAGHKDDRRPWHVWVYRGDLAQIGG